MSHKPNFLIFLELGIFLSSFVFFVQEESLNIDKEKTYVRRAATYDAKKSLL